MTKPTTTGRVRKLKNITVLIAEDHTLVRQAMCKLLKKEGCFKVVGQAKNGSEAVKMAQIFRPDVILMDIAMPVLNGLQATRQILIADPAAKVLIVSGHSDAEYIECMTAVGVAGFLEKQTAAENLIKAIHEVVNGHRFFSPAIAKRMANGKNWSRDYDGRLQPDGVRLTSRETNVIKLVAEGQANQQVAATLGINIKTVEKLRQHILDKLNIHETADLIRYAIEQRLIESRVKLTII